MSLCLVVSPHVVRQLVTGYHGEDCSVLCAVVVAWTERTKNKKKKNRLKTISRLCELVQGTRTFKQQSCTPPTPLQAPSLCLMCRSANATHTHNVCSSHAHSRSEDAHVIMSPTLRNVSNDVRDHVTVFNYWCRRFRRLWPATPGLRNRGLQVTGIRASCHAVLC